MNKQKELLLEEWFNVYQRTSAFQYTEKEKASILADVKRYCTYQIRQDIEYMRRHRKGSI